MLQRFPIALAQVKVCNTSENLPNEIRQITYFFYREKKIAKKVYNNIDEFNKVIKKNGYCIYEFWKQQNIWSLQTISKTYR